MGTVSAAAVIDHIGGLRAALIFIVGLGLFFTWIAAIYVGFRLAARLWPSRRAREQRQRDHDESNHPSTEGPA